MAGLSAYITTRQWTIASMYEEQIIVMQDFGFCFHGMMQELLTATIRCDSFFVCLDKCLFHLNVVWSRVWAFLEKVESGTCDGMAEVVSFWCAEMFDFSGEGFEVLYFGFQCIVLFPLISGHLVQGVVYLSTEPPDLLRCPKYLCNALLVVLELTLHFCFAGLGYV